MTHATDNAVPDRDYLRDVDPEGFALQMSPGRGLKVSLLEVQDGVAMNGSYECYSLLLALPDGISLPQAVFNLFGPGREHPWPLLMTPLAPDAKGRHVLQAVIHRSRLATGEAP